jgi:hypothetical protein
MSTCGVTSKHGCRERLMKATLILTESGDYVSVRAAYADCLRDYLLRHGVPCALPERSQHFFRAIRLGKTANLGQVQALLDQWGTRT